MCHSLQIFLKNNVLVLFQTTNMWYIDILLCRLVLSIYKSEATTVQYLYHPFTHPGLAELKALSFGMKP